MNKKISMRDTFWNEIYELAKRDKEITIVDADMGAPSLDKFRERFRECGQYYSVGIAEQAMISISAGLAKEGKKVFTYAIAPFLTSRCHEFTNLAGLMNIPLKLVGVGAGFSYEDSGPTHHALNDIAIMRVVPNLEIYSPSDSMMAGKIAREAHRSKNPSYIRLDREILPDISKESEEFHEGFRELKKGKNVVIISAGNLVHTALKASEQRGIGVVDLYRLKPIDRSLIKVLAKYQKAISLEEHFYEGGLGSILAETIIDKKIKIQLKRMAVREYVYEYGKRENIQKKCGIGLEDLRRNIESLDF